MRVPVAVRTDKSVVAEVVGSSVIIVEVSSVSPNLTTLGIGPANRLIDKIPNITTLEFRILAYHIPVLLESTLRVAHCMSIFALDERLVELSLVASLPILSRLVLAVVLAARIAVVHRAEDVGELAECSLLILARARRVFVLDPLVCLLKVLAHTCLIAERPDDNRRMVEVSLHIALVTFHVSKGKDRVLGKSLLAISHSVTLKVGLGCDIKTILVAEVIPIAVVRIMACAHCIDVHLLHLKHVLKHAFARNDITAIRVEFMSVGTLDQNWLAIDKELCILDLDVAESHIDRNHLNHLATCLESSSELIEIRSLGCPCLDIGNLHGHSLLESRGSGCGLGNTLAISILKVKLNCT